MYLNVLEHIPDDATERRLSTAALGRVESSS
jgi:hypothetical protein